MATVQLTTLQHSDSIELADWLDTDVSEDEDYLPQFPYEKFTSAIDYYSRSDHKINATSCTEQTTTELNSMSNWDTKSKSTAKVTEIINTTIDNGLEKVDFSDLALTELPEEIKELLYVTVVRNGVVKSASLQLFLFNNQLTSLNSILFTLRNLTVLSLRHNHLTSIPPEIASLENLNELSIGNNQLEYIPAELLRLKKLKLLTLLPNLYLPYNGRKVCRSKSTIATLKELSIRTIWANKLALNSSIPSELALEVKSVSSVNLCQKCSAQFYEPDIKEIHWRDVFGYSDIPVMYRLCSISCSLNINI